MPLITPAIYLFNLHPPKTIQKLTQNKMMKETYVILVVFNTISIVKYKLALLFIPLLLVKQKIK